MTPGAELLVHVREELQRADSKSSLLLSAAGVAIGALMGGLIAGDWSPFELSNGVEWLWWVGVVAATGGVFALAWAVFPRTIIKGRVIPAAPAYYKDVVAYETPQELQVALEAGAARGESHVPDQLLSISKIVDRKYELIRFAMRALGVAVLCCSVAVLLNPG
jgi:MFS family permease